VTIEVALRGRVHDEVWNFLAGIRGRMTYEKKTEKGGSMPSEKERGWGLGMTQSTRLGKGKSLIGKREDQTRPNS